MFAVFALAPCAVVGRPRCASSGSGTSISCYVGESYSGTLPSGGLCICKCGASSSVADYDYSSNNVPKILREDNVEVTQFGASAASACSNVYCGFRFARACPTSEVMQSSSGYVNASYYPSYAAFIATKAPATSVINGTDTMCFIKTVTCTASRPCGILTSGAMVTYGALTGDDIRFGVSYCQQGHGMVTLPLPIGTSINKICNMNNCNVPGSPSDPPPFSGAAAVLGGTAVAAAAAAVAALAVIAHT